MNESVEINDIPVNVDDILFDYLMGDMPEYKDILDKMGMDTNPDNWTEFTTLGTFIHFQHKITGRVL